jgi:hypothetical protein
MKKKFLIIGAILFLLTSLFAQNQGISIGGNVNLPVGEWGDVANTGFGGSATYEHPMGKNVMGVIYTGYSYFDGVSEGNSWSMIPLLAGVKYYLSNKQDWYFGFLMGVNFITHDYSNILITGSDNSAYFAGNANFGYELKTSEKGALDISAGFMFINQQSFIGLRAAYIFKL